MPKFSNEQVLFLQQLNLINMSPGIKGNNLFALLGAAYENVDAKWASQFAVINFDPQTNIVYVAYVPFVKVNI